MAIDLHTHSTYSDGADTPQQLLKNALDLQLTAIALTDHDTANGVTEFMKAAFHKPIRVIPGIEISASYLGHDIHILGYHINPEDSRLNNRLKEIRKERSDRNFKLIDRLQSLGYALSYDEVSELAEDVPGSTSDKVISRLHFGKALLRRGYVKTINEAFDTILNPGCPGYIPRHQIEPEEALSLIHESGGMAVLAHPLLYKLSLDELKTLLERLKYGGLKGLEVIHSTVSPEQTQVLKELANVYHLHYTGGSDYHGINKPNVPLGVGKEQVLIPDSFSDWL